MKLVKMQFSYLNVKYNIIIINYLPFVGPLHDLNYCNNLYNYKDGKILHWQNSRSITSNIGTLYNYKVFVDASH